MTEEQERRLTKLEEEVESLRLAGGTTCWICGKPADGGWVRILFFTFHYCKEHYKEPPLV
jgi:hypothetical protein